MLVCHKKKIGPVAAVVRVFSGGYGGGFAACKLHTQTALTKAMKPLIDPNCPIDPAKYTVEAFEVKYAPDGFPSPGRKLFTARRKVAA